MGVAPYKYFTFDGESSRSYDVYLTGTGVFNAPERAVEMLEIAGRNGNYALDQGKFNNITVTYKAGIVDASESNFADKMSAVRNWLCSKVGYKRLSDDYNANEYRMAVFKSGVTLDHADLKTGEFEITFDCKPQRWLTSGETATAVANNGTLSNPTKFDAEPLLAITGYGEISFNGYTIDVGSVAIGDVILSSGVADSLSTRTITINGATLMTGDTITINSITNTEGHSVKADATITNTQFGSLVNCRGTVSDNNRTLQMVADPMTFTYGTASTSTASLSFGVSYNDGTSHYYSSPCTITVEYDGANTFTVKTPAIIGASGPYSSFSRAVTVSQITAYSTKLVSNNIAYIDCEIGECWMESGGAIVSLNNLVTLGSDLPTLASGTNTFTYDNTVTELKVTPRWWKV